jgi:hypothetical protein
MATVSLLVHETQKLILNHPLRVYTPHDLGGILNSKDSISMFLLFANYIAMGLGLLGTLAPLYRKSYSPSWKTNRFLNLF